MNTPPELGPLVQRGSSKHTMRHDLREWQLDALRDVANLVEKELDRLDKRPCQEGDCMRAHTYNGMREWGKRAAKVLRNNGQFGVSALADEWDDRWGG